jgi:hypothetical protein
MAYASCVTVTIRAALLEDEGAVLDLIEELFEPPGGIPPAYTRERGRQGFRHAVQQPGLLPKSTPRGYDSGARSSGPGKQVKELTSIQDRTRGVSRSFVRESGTPDDDG